MGPGRFELPTSRLSGVRSNLLSYEPVLKLYRRLRAFGFNYKLNKEQQKNRCLKLPAAFLKCGHQRLPISSLKQKYISYQDFLQNSNLVLSGGLVNIPANVSIIDSITVSTYSQVFFKFFFIFRPPNGYILSISANCSVICSKMRFFAFFGPHISY